MTHTPEVEEIAKKVQFDISTKLQQIDLDTEEGKMTFAEKYEESRRAILNGVIGSLTTLTTKHQAELQKAVDEAFKRGKQHFLKDIRRIEPTNVGKKVGYIMFDEVGEVDWDKLSDNLTPTTPDKQ